MEAPHSSDCPKFLENVTKFCDGSMSDDEKKAFLASIDDNCDCLEKLEIEKKYKEFLATKIERKCCSDKLLSSIRNAVKS